MVWFFIFVMIAKRIYDLFHPINYKDPNNVLNPSKNTFDGSVNFKQIFFITFILTGLFNLFAFSGALGLLGYAVMITFPTMIFSGFIWLILVSVSRKSNK